MCVHSDNDIVIASKRDKKTALAMRVAFLSLRLLRRAVEARIEIVLYGKRGHDHVRVDYG